MTDRPELPPGLTRRQFLEDLLDVMGDAGSIVHHGPDGTVELEVTRAELLTELAAEMDRP
jgi:hypothetical protein